MMGTSRKVSKEGIFGNSSTSFKALRTYSMKIDESNETRFNKEVRVFHTMMANFWTTAERFFVFRFTITRAETPPIEPFKM